MMIKNILESVKSKVFEKGKLKEISFSANVDNYDYFHEIRLYNNGVVEFWDGGCQLQLAHAKSKYRLKRFNENEIKIEFFDCILTDPYDESIIFTTIKPFEVKAIKKETYIIYPDAPVRYPENQVIYLYYYQFNKDPLAIFREYSSYFNPKYMDSEMVDYINGMEDEKYKSELKKEYSENGVRLNPLENKFYCSEDKVIRKTILEGKK